MTKDEARLLEEKYGGDTTVAGFAADCGRLARGEPLAYVIGYQPFLGLKIWLDSKPLIPRPETEWWTEELLKVIRRKQQGASGMRFLDLCTGSGAIGCAALARLPDAHVYFGELDPAHEATIRKNIRETLRSAARDTTMIYHSGVADTPQATMIYHSGLGRADVRIGDLFEPFDSKKRKTIFSPIGENMERTELTRFDVIAANPPYIPRGRALDASVENFEPALALRAGDDGLDCIRRIAKELPRRLRTGGAAWIECDASHANAARALFEGAGLSASIIPDQYGAPRVIAVSWT